MRFIMTAVFALIIAIVFLALGYTVFKLASRGKTKRNGAKRNDKFIESSKDNPGNVGTETGRLRKALDGFKAPDGTRFRIESKWLKYHSAARLFPPDGRGSHDWELVTLEVKDRLGRWVPTVYAPVIIGDIENIRNMVKIFHAEYVDTSAFTEVPSSVATKNSWKFEPYHRDKSKRSEDFLHFKMDGMKVMKVNGESTITSDLGDHRDAVVAALQYNRARVGLNKVSGEQYWKSIEQAARNHNQMDPLEREILQADLQWRNKRDKPEQMK